MKQQWLQDFEAYLDRKNIDSKIPKHVVDYIQEQLIEPWKKTATSMINSRKETEIKNKTLLEVIDDLTTKMSFLSRENEQLKKIQEPENILS